MAKFVSVMSLEWICNECQIMSEIVFDCLYTKAKLNLMAEIKYETNVKSKLNLNMNV